MESRRNATIRSQALHEFPVEMLAKHSSVAGIAPSAEALGTRSETKTDRFCWADGKWLLAVPDSQSTAFELRASTTQGEIIFRCQRLGKSKFSLVSVTHDPVIPLCPPPYTFCPDR